MDLNIELGPLPLSPKTRHKKKYVRRGNLIWPDAEMERFAKIKRLELCQTPMSQRLVETVDG